MGLIINYLVARPNYYLNIINEFRNIKNLCNESLVNIATEKKNLNIDTIEKRLRVAENIYSKFVDELNYSNKKFNLDVIDKSMDLCRQIFFHIKSIELLEKELFLNIDNHKKLQEFYKNGEIKIKIKENESPVFNFHLSKITDKMNSLEELITTDI